MAEEVYLRYHSGEVEGEECSIGVVNQEGVIPRRPSVNELLVTYTTVPEFFFCPSCKEIFRAPTIASCGCVYCRQCITDLVQKENPVCLVKACQTPLENKLMASPFMQRNVNAMELQCDYGLSYDVKMQSFEAIGWKSGGCTKVVKYSEYEQHFQDCEMAWVPCPFKRDGCDTVCARGDLASHQLECSYNVHVIPCKHKDLGCEAVLKEVELEEHINTCEFAIDVEFAEVAIRKCLDFGKRKVIHICQNNAQTESDRQGQLGHLEEELLKMLQVQTKKLREKIREVASKKFKTEWEGLGVLSSNPSSRSSSPTRSFDSQVHNLGRSSTGTSSHGFDERVASEMDSLGMANSPSLAFANLSLRSSICDDVPSPLRDVNGVGSQHRSRIYTEIQVVRATDNFSKHNRIGCGAFGAVYRGVLDDGEQVAVKKLHEENRNYPLEREVDVLRRLSHPNVVRLMGYCPEAMCIVSEYLAGGNLHNRLKGDRSTLKFTDRIRICLEMAEALCWMHSLKILHRDLKPMNVLLSENGTAKLCDMGLAKVLDMTIQKSLAQGTAGYLDPHWYATQQYSSFTDVYGLGLIMLQLLMGESNIGKVHDMFDRCGRIRSSDQSVELFLKALDTTAGTWPRGIAASLVKLALRCADRTKESRPNLRSTVQPELKRMLREATEGGIVQRGVNRGQTRLNELTASAAAGSSEAQNELGNWYRNGYLVEKNFKAAFKCYTEAACQGHAEAMYNLGLWYEQEGSDQNYGEAFKWYVKAADKSHAGAQSKLGDCYKNGKGCLADLTTAIEWYRRAADEGNHPDGQFNLGLAYLKGEGVGTNPDLAIYYFEKAAEQNHLGALNHLGYVYRVGNGVEKDLEKAFEYYELAASGGHPVSKNHLGFCYFNGEGVTQNYKEAGKCYLESARSGHARAQYNVGMCYSAGKGFSEDQPSAAYWFERAAEQGHLLSQLEIAKRYKEGNGVQKSACEAVKWWRKACEKGNADAEYELAECLLSGDVAKKSTKEAKRLLQLAGQKGHKHAKVRLGELRFSW